LEVSALWDGNYKILCRAFGHYLRSVAVGFIAAAEAPGLYSIPPAAFGNIYAHYARLKPCGAQFCCLSIGLFHVVV
jgi:hypothetical protein